MATLGIPSGTDPGSSRWHPMTKAPFLSSISLSWLDPILKDATTRAMSPSDMWDVDEELSVHHNLSDTEFRPSWRVFIPKVVQKGLIWTIAGSFPWVTLTGVGLGLTNLFAMFTQPFLLRSLLEHRNAASMIALFCATILAGVSEAHMKYQLRIIGIKIRSALTAAICDHSLRVAAKSFATEGPDPSVLIDVDLFRVFEFVEMFHTIWMLPLQLLVCLGGLISILGWQSVLAGSFVPLIVIPLLGNILRKMSRLMGEVMSAKDVRVELISQVVRQIKQIKLAVLQPVFREKLATARDEELMRLAKVGTFNAAMVFLVSLQPVALILASLQTFAFLGGALTSSVIFPALAFFFTITRSLAMFPTISMRYQACQVSFDRVRDFLSTDDTDRGKARDQFRSQVERESRAESRPGRVSVDCCNINLPSADPGSVGKPILRDCFLTASPGQMVVITGPVGSGKTTFLRALIGNIQPSSGLLEVIGSVAYAPQKPFLINGTVRENILFGLPFDGPFYELVVNAVELKEDILRLLDGDATDLGGTGVALSGGQKSRVGLARAIYARRKVVVLDDPLAAVDARVSKSLATNVLSPEGILKDSTRVVVSNSKHLLAIADAAYTILDGTLEGLSKASAPYVDEPTVNQDLGSSTPDDVKDTSTTKAFSYGAIDNLRLKLSPEVTQTDLDLEEGAPLLRKISSCAAGAQDEAVPLATYLRFTGLAKRYGWCIVILVACISKLVEVTGIYLLKLSSEEFETRGSSNKLMFYATCGLCSAILSATFVVTAYSRCVIPTARSIHADLVDGLLGTKFRFFDTTPTGQILSRFTNDLNKTDLAVSGGFISLAATFVSATSSILVIVGTSWLSLPYLVPLGVVYVMIQSYYLHACRQIRRLENAARGPLLNVVSEMRNGAAVIISFGQLAMFHHRARQKIDDYVRIWAPFVALDVWLLLRLQFLSSLIQFLSAALLLWLDSTPSTLGLVMNFVIQITAQFNVLVQNRANLEADITSTERVFSYVDLEPEERSVEKATVPLTWPRTPVVQFKSFTMGYQPNQPPCLRDINITINAGDHIAVVGRTGAGKSSFALALLRGIDSEAVHNGEIVVDGQDISSLRIDDVRRRITLLPQEPPIFRGTLRDNVDPCGMVAEEKIRNIVNDCLIPKLLGMETNQNPLELRIDSSGSNLSAGQIQAIALARAMLSESKIVILDEATGTFDASVCNLVEEAIRTRFQGCTVISITHSIRSAMTYDKVLVLNAGEVVGFGPPAKLLEENNLLFCQLVQEVH